jgi:diguanylate cyclase (GGDEF)-like protein/PAS domain S-box-containing protein
MAPSKTELTIAAPPAPAILIVDDNAAKRLATRTMLAPLGHTLVEADSGRGALRAVLRQTFAMILMDVRMPSLDGYETAKLIRQRRQSAITPIIFVTGFGRDETETNAAYAGGAVDFIFNPIHPEVLRAKVTAFVNLFQQSQALQSSLDSITALNVSLRESEVRARAVLQHVADGIVTAGERGLIESFNRSARRLFGYRADEVIGQPLKLIVAPSHHDIFSATARTQCSAVTANDTPAEPIETVGCRKDGSCFPMEMDVSEMQIGERSFTIACIRDISGRKAYSEALEHRSLHDELTGLPNRVLFGDRLDQAIAAADRAGEPRGILIVALDRLGDINDIRGHETGDGVLRAVAERLRGVLRDSDTVGRVGGDEFGILLAGETDVARAATTAWKIRNAFEDPYVIAGHVIDVQASIGIAFFPRHGRVVDDLMRRAEVAMHEARQSGTGIAVFVVDPEDQTAHRLQLLGDLRDGIARGELVLHYQPKIDLATRRTIGVEALVRWRHPRDGLLMPGQFIPEAEQSTLIEPLTAWVLDEALHQQRRWLDAGLDLSMAVNISPRSLMPRSDLAETVAAATETWGIAPGRLILELTERAIIDADAPDVLELLHAMGERLAVDDFGTGHSSLVYLQRLPIDEIKVDRTFICHMASVPSDAVIARSTIELGHNLGLIVVAEGVEDEAALALLVEDGCDIVQGYLFSPGLPADDLTRWLAESPFGALPGALPTAAG